MQNPVGTGDTTTTALVTAELEAIGNKISTNAGRISVLKAENKQLVKSLKRTAARLEYDHDETYQDENDEYKRKCMSKKFKLVQSMLNRFGQWRLHPNDAVAITTLYPTQKAIRVLTITDKLGSVCGESHEARFASPPFKRALKPGVEERKALKDLQITWTRSKILQPQRKDSDAEVA